MIVVTRLNGPTFALNPDLIERVEANPDTVVVLIGGASYPIAESVTELLDRVRDYRSQVIASAHAAEFPADRRPPGVDRRAPVATHESSGAERTSPGAKRKLHILPTSDAE
jgi:flagellar protein FlbD